MFVYLSALTQFVKVIAFNYAHSIHFCDES